ncbi:ATP-dependent DNA helicase [Ruminococcaceae bacterium OttesenSCG-928-D13]|nr:ATP-dependent DNA helicase [Ruminococcaceae bacterium OttesenSCG-928-D13]
MHIYNPNTHEIDFNIPFGLLGHTYDEGKPLFTAYGCVLFEKEMSNGYRYCAYDLKTNRSQLISRRKNPLGDEDFGKAAAKIRTLFTTGRSRYEADRTPGEKLSEEELAQILEHVFHKLLPAHGYTLRRSQAELAAHTLDALCRRRVSLSEAEVGVGKTLAYLTSATLVKRGRANDFWYRGAFPGQNWADSARMPVVVSTSSIALQNALVREYIPELSRILMEGGIIREPLTAVLRKGREHYLCERRLRTYLMDADEATAALLLPLLEQTAAVDLASVENLTPYMKRRIGVSGRCDYNCPHREICRHRRHLAHVQSNRHDFQICNHQFLLADIHRRRDKQKPLLPHYQAVIIDEGHKFLAAARQLYGVELAAAEIPLVTEEIYTLTMRSGESAETIRTNAKKLRGQNGRLTKHLLAGTAIGEIEEDADKLTVFLDKDSTRHLRNIRCICSDLMAALHEQRVSARHRGRHSHILWELTSILKRVSILEKHTSLICWTEERGADTALCAIPKNLDELLLQDFWSKGLPIVLTSGTLSAAGDFSRIKQTLGLHRLPEAYQMETSKPSPFDHHANTLLYISEQTPFPDNHNREYLDAISDEVERLILASHAHAAVLFTSYNAMGLVYTTLLHRDLPFPMFRMGRGDTTAINQFKESGNGVLFASGALWEGIDIPGDALSMLIIVRLPFAVPDPITEYEQSLYPNMAAYKDSVVLPDMLVKLKQGFGRLIRTETDSGVVALLDCRAREGAPYREQVLRALPSCRVTGNMQDVGTFLRTKKAPGYFE